MNASITFRPIRLFGPLLLLLLSAPAPLQATAPVGLAAHSAGAAPLLLAQEDGTTVRRSWRSYLLSGLTNRTRVVQVCVAVMALALFILMKKLT